eukprot:Gb_06785 [translate_table: standard]
MLYKRSNHGSSFGVYANSLTDSEAAKAQVKNFLTPVPVVYLTGVPMNFLTLQPFHPLEVRTVQHRFHSTWQKPTFPTRRRSPRSLTFQLPRLECLEPPLKQLHGGKVTKFPMDYQRLLARGQWIIQEEVESQSVEYYYSPFHEQFPNHLIVDDGQ